MGFAPGTIVRLTDRQVSARLGDEDVILGLSSGEYFGLDGVGSFVWDRLREPVTVADLESAIVSGYEVAPEQCRADLQELLASLESKELIERVPAN